MHVNVSVVNISDNTPTSAVLCCQGSAAQSPWHVFALVLIDCETQCSAKKKKNVCTVHDAPIKSQTEKLYCRWNDIRFLFTKCATVALLCAPGSASAAGLSCPWLLLPLFALPSGPAWRSWHQSSCLHLANPICAERYPSPLSLCLTPSLALHLSPHCVFCLAFACTSLLGAKQHPLSNSTELNYQLAGLNM